jgi:hypothetical protein
MRITLAAVVSLFASLAIAAPPSPATKPATRPAASRPAPPPPKQKFSLMNGAIRYTLPEGWTESSRGDDGKTAQYTSPDEKAVLFVGVQQEQYPVPAHNEAFKENMKNQILNSMKKYQAEKNVEALYGPKSETDDRFLLRIHDTIKEGHEVMDQIHLYRAGGLNILMVTSVVKTDDKDEAKPYHKVGEETCLSMVVGPADKKK